MLRIQAFLFSVIILLSHCVPSIHEPDFPRKSAILGLASRVQLEPEITVVDLGDYFLDIDLIDSVKISAGFNTGSWDTSNEILIHSTENSPPLGALNIYVGDNAYAILLYKSMKRVHTLTFEPGNMAYKDVAVAAEFNSWNPAQTELTFSEGVWSVDLILEPGQYQYQIVRDGAWGLDPSNPDSVDNNIGGYNSLLKIPAKASSPAPVISLAQYDNRVIRVQVENDYSEIFALWNNFRLPQSMVNRKENIISIRIPKQSELEERSWIRLLVDNGSSSSNDLLIPLAYGSVLDNVNQLQRYDKHAIIMYFMMVDRFNNGETSNDKKVDNPMVADRANYYGGDLEGITEKINEGYFSDLHVNTLWLSPIGQNPPIAYQEWPAPKRYYSGYHGYWPISSSKIDYRFGNSEEFKELVDNAHEMNMNVLLDYVSNHVHEEHPLYKLHPDWATQLDLPDGRKNIRIWDEHRLTTWFDTFLPSLDYSKEEVVDRMTDSAIFWIDEYDLDGFRHDATKHIPEIFWKTLSRKLKEEIIIPENKELFQIGETFGNRELIGNYVSSGQLDGQFDFNLYFDARSVFALEEVSFKRLATSLEATFNSYGYHSLMGNITGNHDMPRFISFASGDLKFDEDVTEAGWERTITVTNPVGYQRLGLLSCFTTTIPGIPVIYYGDEIGMPGAHDPDNRRPMKFSGLTEYEKVHKEKVSLLLKIRSDNLSLIYGDFQFIIVEDELLAYTRSYFENQTIVFLNKSNKELKAEIPLDKLNDAERLNSHFGQNWYVNGSNLTVTLEPYSFEIFTSN